MLGTTFQGVKSLLRTPVKLGWALLGYLTFVLGLGFVVEQVLDLNTASQQRELAEQEQRIFANEVSSYQHRLGTYQSCLTAVEQRDDTRRQWTSFYDALVEEFGDNERFVAVINGRMRIELDQNYPRKSVEDCADPGPPPLPPQNEN